MNVALGVAGLQPLLDYRGSADSFGRRLDVDGGRAGRRSWPAPRKSSRERAAGTPVAIVRGAAEWTGDGTGRLLVRDAQRDLFR